jgi:DNA-directed RNA polymerase specialized sigma24 family protein
MASEPVVISEIERRELRLRAGQYTRPYREVIRAKLVLLAAEGLSDVEIAARLDCTDRMVSKWRRRFRAEGLAGFG